MKRLAFSIFGIAAAACILYQKLNEVINIVVVLIYMTVFSLLLAPICTRMETHGIKPSHAAVYAVAGLFLIVLMMFAALIPYLGVQSMNLFKRISPIAIELAGRLTQWVQNFKGATALFTDAGQVIGMLLSSLAGKLVQAGISAAAQIGRMGFSLVLTYYVLCDRNRISNHLLLIVPITWRKAVLSALSACRNAMMGYFSGLMKTSVFVTAATAIGLLALGVQDAVLLALLMGILEILPYLGPVLAAIPIVLSAMMQGAETALLVLAMLVLVQQIEGNFITPYFTASSTSVHPLAAILSIFVLGSLLGIWGILIAVPMVALIQSIWWSLRKIRCMMKLQS